MASPRMRRNRSTTIRTVGSRALLAPLFLALTAFAHPLRAEVSDARAQASQSFREAKAAFARRDYGAAAAAFEQAAKLAPHPAPWLNAAEAWEKRGDLVRAAEDCDRALEVPDGDEALKKEAEARLAQVLSRVATLDIVGARSYSVRIDQGDAAPVPFRRRLSVGAHRIDVTDLTTNRERTIEATVAAGESKRIDLGASPAPASPESAPPAKTIASKGPPLGTWIMFGVGGAFAIATGVAGGLTLSAQNQFNTTPTQEALDRFRLDRALTNVFLATAAVTAGIGAGIWIFAPSSTGDSARTLRARASVNSVDLSLTF